MTASLSRPPRNVHQLRTTRRPAGHPDPARLAVAVVRTLLEVEAGRRPLAQLERVLSPSALARVATTMRRRRDQALARGRAPRIAGPSPDSVRAVLVDRPAPEAVEAAVAVRTGSRTTAVCVRLERWQGAWRVTELTRPEDGLPPVRPGRPSRQAAPLGTAPAEAIDLTDARDATNSRP